MGGEEEGRERDPRTFAVIGAAMEAHGELGPGFLEAVYRDALAVELSGRGVPFGREVELPVFYKGGRLDARYRADFLCFETVVVEVKAQQRLTAADEAQLLNYLKASGRELGLLLNFGAPSLQYKRLVLSMPERPDP